MSNDAFDQYNAWWTLQFFCIKYLQFYYKQIVRSEKNKPSHCATGGYLTFIILNEH